MDSGVFWPLLRWSLPARCCCDASKEEVNGRTCVLRVAWTFHLLSCERVYSIFLPRPSRWAATRVHVLLLVAWTQQLGLLWSGTKGC